MIEKVDDSSVGSFEEGIVEKKPYSWLGYVFALIAAIGSATGSLFFKITDEDKMKVVLIRSILQYLILYPAITWKKGEIVTSNAKTNALLLVRGLLFPTTFGFVGFSLDYLSLGDSMAIFYTYPAMVGLFACICLKGKFEHEAGTVYAEMSKQIAPTLLLPEERKRKALLNKISFELAFF